MRKKRRQVDGYLYMGDVTIPPLPVNILMEDRADFTIWWLTHNGTDYTITTLNVPTNNIVQYSAYAGPYYRDGNRTYRLYISGGNLQTELSDVAVSSARIICLPATDNQCVEVTAPGGVLTSTVIDLTD